MGGNSNRPFGYARIAPENTWRQFEWKNVTYLNLGGDPSVNMWIAKSLKMIVYEIYYTGSNKGA